MRTVDLAKTPLRELNLDLHRQKDGANEASWEVLNPRGAHAVAVHHEEPVIGFELDFLTLVQALRQGLPYQPLGLFQRRIVVGIARRFQQAGEALGIGQRGVIGVSYHQPAR